MRIGAVAGVTTPLRASRSSSELKPGLAAPFPLSPPSSPSASAAEIFSSSAFERSAVSLEVSGVAIPGFSCAAFSSPFPFPRWRAPCVSDPPAGFSAGRLSVGFARRDSCLPAAAAEDAIGVSFSRRIGWGAVFFTGSGACSSSVLGSISTLFILKVRGTISSYPSGENPATLQLLAFSKNRRWTSRERTSAARKIHTKRYLFSGTGFFVITAPMKKRYASLAFSLRKDFFPVLPMVLVLESLVPLKKEFFWKQPSGSLGPSDSGSIHMMDRRFFFWVRNIIFLIV